MGQKTNPKSGVAIAFSFRCVPDSGRDVSLLIGRSVNRKTRWRQETLGLQCFACGLIGQQNHEGFGLTGMVSPAMPAS